MCLGSGTGRAIDISSAITEALRKGSDVWNCCCSCCWSCLSIWQLSNGGLTAEKAEIVLNGNDAETFLSMGEPDEKPGGVRNPAGLFEPTVCNGTFQMKGRAMNTQIQTSEQLTTATHAGTGASEMDELAQGQALLKWTSLPSTALPLRKSLPCSGSGAGTKAVAAIECSLCATGSSSSGWS